MIIYKSREEVETMDRCNRVVAQILAELRGQVEPGVTTADLDRVAERMCRDAGVRPAFKGYRGYPCVLCTSVNEEVVHGIPSPKKVLKEGDIIGLDFGVVLDGYFGDAAVTVPVGRISREARDLLNVTRESLHRGIQAARPGKRLSDISSAVQTHAESHGYTVVREFVGHGIGTSLHEDPQVPNYGNPGSGPVLKEGLVLAIEPMVNLGGPAVRIHSDGWTASTIDGSLSAHFERSIAITEDGPLVLGGDVEGL
ncbi:MAG TPA: type I methionyl aminopeptidase [Candidatus Polarisedimenticolia bacterium]|jgi:methionyl aminopeptidase|nr:type I methionyl aminopeptidase [Candidatus Polarisedimenticolia bacterium]